MAVNITTAPEILRDLELEQRMLEAVIADRNSQPRSAQLQVGPSEVGGCRELLRAGLFEPPEEAEPETNWALAAHVGTVMGADLERILGERLGAVTQERVTATFGMLGIQISGATDLIFADGVRVSTIGDLKSNADIGGLLLDLKRDASAIETLISIRREGLLYNKIIETPNGDYELTETIVAKIAKLHYYVQIAIYVIGAMQTGLIDENGEGRIVYYDRSGGYQGFIAVRVPPEQIMLFFEIAQMRISQVMQAQTAFEASGGVLPIIGQLRDKAPSYCFSPKVMCPRREHCWTGSEWVSNNQITDPEHISMMRRYDTGRSLETLGKNMKTAARNELKEAEVSGITSDGLMLTWGGSGAINLVKTVVEEPQPEAVLDAFIPPVNLQEEIDHDQRRAIAAERAASVPKPAYDDRWKALEKTKLPGVQHIAKTTGLDHKGRKAEVILRILEHEYPGYIRAKAGQPGLIAETPSEAASDEQPPATGAAEPESAPATQTVASGGYTITAEHGVMEEAMQGGPAGDEASDALIEMAAAQARERFEEEQEPEKDPRIARVHFEPSEPDDEDAPPPPEDEPPLMTQEELDRAEARRKLARGPHVAPLLDKPEPEPMQTAPITLSDGSLYVPLQDEDPKRPGLFVFHIEGKDRLRAQQYDSDEAFRNNALRQRERFTALREGQ